MHPKFSDRLYLIESRERRGSVEPALPFPPAAKEPITARFMRKLKGGTPKVQSQSESSEGNTIVIVDWHS